MCEKQVRTYFSLKMPKEKVGTEMGYTKNYLSLLLVSIV
jgi:hypothetical protein